MLRGIVIGPIPIRFEYADDAIELQFRLGKTTVTFIRGKTLKMATVLPDDSELPFVLPAFGLDSRGNQVVLKTPPSVRSGDETLLTIVQPDPQTPDNPLSGVARAVGPLGTVQLVVEDVDESTQPLMALVDITIVPGDLVSLSSPTLGPVRKIPTT